MCPSYDARVVIERAHDREIDEDVAGQTLLDQQVVGGLEIVEPLRAPKRRRQRANLLDGLAAAANTRKPANGIGENRRRCTRNAGLGKFVDLDEI